MNFGEDIRRGYSALLHPGSESKSAFSIWRALGFYYALTAIPFVLYVVIGYIMVKLGLIATLMPFYSSLSPIGVLPALLLTAILYFWILVPIGLFINAFIYQLIGKNFLRLWNGSYEKTFTAAMFGALPVMLFYWLVSIPVVNALYLGIMGVWGLIVLTVALSNQQKVKRIEAFWAMGVAVVLTLILVMIVVLLITSAFTPFAAAPGLI